AVRMIIGRQQHELGSGAGHQARLARRAEATVEAAAHEADGRQRDGIRPGRVVHGHASTQTRTWTAPLAGCRPAPTSTVGQHKEVSRCRKILLAKKSRSWLPTASSSRR